MNVLSYWAKTHDGLPTVKSVAEVEQKLDAAAADISKLVSTPQVPNERRRYRHEHWSAIGVDPVQSNISSSGAAYRRGERLRVIVRADQPLLRQRYTIAHEIGHCLLRQLLEVNSVQLEGKAEELLCDAFASKMLVPEPTLKALTSKYKNAPTSKVVLEWCKQLEVNIEPMLIALNSHWRWASAAILYCQNYAHRRDSEPALRLLSYAAPKRLYLPRHKRVQSLGLKTVDSWFHSEQVGYGSGTDEKVRLSLYERDTFDAKTGFIEGPVEWSAMRLSDSTQGAGRVFVDLQLSGEWAIKWAGGVAQPFEPARLVTPEKGAGRAAKTQSRKVAR